MKTFTLVVTGARTRTDRDVIWAALDRVASRALANGYDRVVVRHGKAGRGADAIARDWVLARSREGMPVGQEPFPADWGTHGQAAGLIRNGTMLAAEPRPDDVLAFPDPCPGTHASCRGRGRHNTHGTTDCVGKALAAGIPVTEVMRARTDPAPQPTPNGERR